VIIHFYLINLLTQSIGDNQVEVLRNRSTSGKDVAHVTIHSTKFGYQHIPEVNEHRDSLKDSSHDSPQAERHVLSQLSCDELMFHLDYHITSAFASQDNSCLYTLECKTLLIKGIVTPGISKRDRPRAISERNVAVHQL
jgi:hypothetical protein